MRKQVNRLCKQRGNEMFLLLPTREWMFGNINSLRTIRYRGEATFSCLFELTEAEAGTLLSPGNVDSVFTVCKSRRKFFKVITDV